MRIACVDKQASDRLHLQQRFEQALDQARKVLGHINFVEPFPATRDELIFGNLPDIIAVGPAFSTEEAYTLCRELRAHALNIPLLIFLDSGHYSLRSLRRFQQVGTEIFSTDEPPTRLLHTLSTLSTSFHNSKAGTLIVATGVKGGVGATSVVSGLAHAAEASGRSAVVIDLSKDSVFAQYMCATRWHSPDYGALLADNILPDKSFVERCLVQAPNGVSLFLPPAGDGDIREYWLRDTTRFELSLMIIDILRDLFDVVIVDTANTEGILPFALCSRAKVRLLVTSNEPASVHLLNNKLSELNELPGEAVIHIFLNSILRSGLTKDDVLDFLYLNQHFDPIMITIPPIAYDLKGSTWIGTGNTFYTESSSATQRLLDKAFSTILLPHVELREKQSRAKAVFSHFKRLPLLSKVNKQINNPPRGRLLLPPSLVSPREPQFETAPPVTQSTLHTPTSMSLTKNVPGFDHNGYDPSNINFPLTTTEKEICSSASIAQSKSAESVETGESLDPPPAASSVLYESPKKHVNGIGVNI